MAYGVIKVIPASGHVEASFSGQAGGDNYPSIKLLNPNDGVVYVARNRDCPSVNYGDWDWKIPSQSYAMLPGPFSTFGMFYLDQSGAGRQGEITVYPSQQRTDDPFFNAIGRALQAQTTALDVTEGPIPANPGSGIARLWVDTSDFLHILNSAGTDAVAVDTLTALGGALSGHLPNPGLAAGAALNFSEIVQGSTATTTSTTAVILSGYSSTLTIAGRVVIGAFSFSLSASIAGSIITLYVRIDGGAWTPFAQITEPTANYLVSMSGLMAWTPAPGAHTFDVGWSVSSGTMNMNPNANSGVVILDVRG